MIDVHEFLTNLIRGCGKPIPAIARGAGTSPQYIYAILRGDRTPGSKLFLKLVEQCGNPDIRSKQTKLVDLEMGVKSQMSEFSTVVRKPCGSMFQKGDVVTVKCPAENLRDGDYVVYFDGKRCDLLQYHKLSDVAFLSNPKSKRIEIKHNDPRIAGRVTELRRSLE